MLLVDDQQAEARELDVVLDQAPTDDVTISIGSSDTTEGTVNVSSLVFNTGNYGTNVNFMVTQSAWENEAALGDLFVTRKCFATDGRRLKGHGISAHRPRR